MERPFTQREWQHIRLASIAGAGAVADRAFYAAFYDRLLAGGHSIDEQWAQQKRLLGRWILEEFLGDAPKDGTRVLSIGAGLGTAEAEVAREGYSVDVLDCQAPSLRAAVAECAQLRPLVGDARALPLRRGQYALVMMAAVDYAFPRREYERVLAEVGRVSAPGARIVIVCVSNLSLRAIVRSMRPRTAPADGDEVAWGVQRTAGEHIAAGARAGLSPDRVFELSPAFEMRAVRSARSWRGRAPTWRETVLAISFSRT